MPLPKFVGSVKASWKEVKEVKKEMYKLLFEVVRGRKGAQAEGMGCTKAQK